MSSSGGTPPASGRPGSSRTPTSSAPRRCGAGRPPGSTSRTWTPRSGRASGRRTRHCPCGSSRASRRHASPRSKGGWRGRPPACPASPPATRASSRRSRRASGRSSSPTAWTSIGTPIARRRPRATMVFFVGDLSWPPNAEGLRWFRERVWPLVRRGAPEASAEILGRDAPADLARDASDAFRIHGGDDTRPFWSRAAVSVVPLLAGGGTRLKILESAACGVPVVSTAIGAEGLDLDAGRGDRDRRRPRGLRARRLPPARRSGTTAAAGGGRASEGRGALRLGADRSRVRGRAASPEPRVVTALAASLLLLSLCLAVWSYLLYPIWIRALAARRPERPPGPPGLRPDRSRCSSRRPMRRPSSAIGSGISSRRSRPAPSRSPSAATDARTAPRSGRAARRPAIPASASSSFESGAGRRRCSTTSWRPRRRTCSSSPTRTRASIPEPCRRSRRPSAIPRWAPRAVASSWRRPNPTPTAETQYWERETAAQVGRGTARRLPRGQRRDLRRAARLRRAPSARDGARRLSDPGAHRRAGERPSFSRATPSRARRCRRRSAARSRGDFASASARVRFCGGSSGSGIRVGRCSRSSSSRARPRGGSRPWRFCSRRRRARKPRARALRRGRDRAVRGRARRERPGGAGRRRPVEAL